VAANISRRGTTVLKYNEVTGEYEITPKERMEQLVGRIKKRLIKIERLNEVRGVRWSGHSADIGIEQSLLSDDRAELRQLQRELGINVTV
jgi:hypothetical protein